MFVGAIPKEVQQILSEHVALWQCADVFVGCSGNFTVERVLSEHARFSLHGNDVSLYTSILGHYFAGQPFRIELNAAYAETFGWLADYLKTPIDAVATVMLATKLADTLGNDGALTTNSYYMRLYKGFQQQWPELHQKTVGKVAKLMLRLADFHCGDVFEWVDRLPANAGFVSYPPFYDTASGGYNRLYKRLGFLFDWDKPTFGNFDDARLKAFIDKVTSRDHWLLGTKEPVEQMAKHLRAVVKTTNHNIPVYVYSSVGSTRVVMPEQKIAPVFTPRLMPGMQIGKTLQVAEIPAPQFQALRSQYLNENIKPVPVSAPYAVMVDGLIVGAFAFSTAPNVAQYSDLSCIYLLSDFAVAPTDYKRLSKLVLHAVLSKEVKLLAERAANRRIRRVATTAFSNNPVSMKYRGLLDLHTHKDTDPAKHPMHKYQLQYTGDLGRWSLAEGMAIWKQKYITRTREAAI